jgi:hypothetical protein
MLITKHSRYFKSQKGDVAFLWNKGFEGNIILPELELRPQVYRVDKQEIMMGLWDGIKLMHRWESKLSFPSHMDLVTMEITKIGINQPSVTLETLYLRLLTKNKQN